MLSLEPRISRCLMLFLQRNRLRVALFFIEQNLIEAIKKSKVRISAV